MIFSIDKELKMAKPVVTSINPDLIPHSDFRKDIWLLSEEPPSRYYFKEKENKNSICNKAFNSSVDAPLKELVTALHKCVKPHFRCVKENLSRPNIE